MLHTSRARKHRCVCFIHHQILSQTVLAVGGVFTGRLSDRILKKWRKRRGGQWVPEDRLRGAIFGAVILVPASILCSGLVTYFIRGKFGLALNFVCLFFNGIGVSTPSFSVDYIASSLVP